jgi:23S rRNA (adenine2503-C2)-methyltransferase
MKKDIRDLSFEELLSAVLECGQPRHRADQICKWLYVKQVLDFSEMTDLPKDMIAYLGEKFIIGGITREEKKISKDGTVKFLWRLADGACIESVTIPSKDRNTVCVSTQVGCKFRCPFCASGRYGFKRNLTPGEITGQVIMAQRSLGKRVTNIVFMGMGEPLDNFPGLARAIRVLNGPKGLSIAARKITVSTCGIVPGIRKLMDLGIQVELSVSLHAINDKLRDVLVPANRKYPLYQLEDVLEDYFKATGRVITLEYALIKGVNDSLKDAEGLSALAKRLKAKVNLLKCNFSGAPGYEAGPGNASGFFLEKLRSRGVKATLRRSRGADIMAACGQLAAGRGQEAGRS